MFVTAQNHKTSFLAAGREAAKETTDGALTSSVWGKAPAFGTGMFDLMWQVILQTFITILKLVLKVVFTKEEPFHNV